MSGATGETFSPDRPALRRCVALAADAFARDVWSRGPLLSPAGALGGSVEAFNDLFSLAAADELLSRRGLRTPFIRIARNGELVGEGRYTRSGGTGALIADQVADDQVLTLFADGHTVVLQGLHRLWPSLIEFAGALVHDLGHPVQINAYITPPSSRGFSAHYDVHDVFVLQVAGTKRWRIHEPVHPLPLRSEPWTDFRAAVESRALETPLIDEVLRPGDALYLPRGFLHSADALGATSCHLTVGVHPVTRQAVVEAAVAAVAGDSALRDSLPLGIDVSDPAQLAGELHKTIDALVNRLRAVGSDSVASRLATQVASGTRAAPVEPLAQAAALDALDANSLVGGRKHLNHAVREDGDQVVVTLPDRTLRLPRGTAKAVRSLLGGARLQVHELPDLTTEDALTLVRRLVREGAAVVLPAG